MAKEYKTKVTFKFEPEGPEVPGAIHSFQLVREERHLEKDGRSTAWRERTSEFKRDVVGEGITRGMVVEIIADGADWLSYVEEGNS